MSDDALLELARSAVGADRVVADHSWPNGESAVLEVGDSTGRTWIAKRHFIDRAYQREVAALRDWAPRLGIGRAPMLLGADDASHSLITDRLDGEAGNAASPDAFRQAGQLTRTLHAAEPHGSATDHAAHLEQQLDSWLQVRMPGIIPADDEDFVRAQVRQLENLPAPETGPIHNDNQPRNWLVGADGVVRFIDFGRSAIDLVVRDFERMYFAEWRQHPELADAFFDGYGRPLSGDELALVRIRGAYQGLSTVLWARQHNSPDFEQHGWDILAQLRQQQN